MGCFCAKIERNRKKCERLAAIRRSKSLRHVISRRKWREGKERRAGPARERKPFFLMRTLIEGEGERGSEEMRFEKKERTNNSNTEVRVTLTSGFSYTSTGSRWMKEDHF